MIVTDSIELAIKSHSEQSYAAQIEFSFNTNLEFINLDEMSSNVIKKDNNKLIVDNQSGNVNLSFKSNIMSRFFVVVTIIRGDQSFSKEFKVER